MRSPLSPLLDAAREGRYAVGTFTAFNAETTRGVFEAIEVAGVPSGIAVTRRMTPFMDFEGLASYIVRRAEAAVVPVAIHLDHATDLELVRRALDAGFTSVQYDAKADSPEARIEATRVGVELARAYGASFEAELDHIGRAGVEAGGGLTEPGEAAAFVRATGIDIVAVSVGTVHGLATGAAKIDTDLIGRIAAVTPAHLALHGGTGVPPAKLVEAIHAGITKVSYFHGMASDALDVLRRSVGDAEHGMLATVLDEALRVPFRDRTLAMLDIYGGPGRAAGNPGSPPSVPSGPATG
jgi:fructose/tagatose bisphosphate aldolase